VQTQSISKFKTRNPWLWIPTLYYAEGIPYIIVMTVSVVMYKRLGISNTDIALYTSWLYLPWMIKPLWSPLVDLMRTKRFWITSMQLLIGAGLAGIALTLPITNPFRYTLAFMWLLALSSATHDIAADGFYMLGLSEHDQAWFVGIRSTCYRAAMLTGQGLLVMLAGYLETATGGRIQFAWSLTFYVMTGVFLALWVYHTWFLPHPDADRPPAREARTGFWQAFVLTFAAFFRKPRIGVILAFLLLYRFSEAQLIKLAAPFLLDTAAAGGLGLSTSQVGFIYGTVGLMALTLGGILGGMLASRNGLKHWLWWMVAAINVPNAVYIILAYALPSQVAIVSVAVAIEQFGYGFGFTAYMLYLIYVCEGEHKTAHFAIGTGLMAAGMMLPAMVSGWIQMLLGYRYFFIWVLLATIPSFIATALIPLAPEFGKKTAQEPVEHT
jgi:PAT family beta-lactamase induction signal transducer AmpG